MEEQSKLRYERRTRLLSKFSSTEIELILAAPNHTPFRVERVALDLLPLLGYIAPQLLTLRTTPERIIDVRGRPREAFPTPPLSLKDEQPRREELFALLGYFPQSEVGEQKEEETPWLIQVLSQFSAFRGPQHIIHSCALSSYGFPDDVAKTLSLAQIGFLLPAVITELRIGLELYKSRFRGSMLSFAAGIEHRLYLELSAKRFRLYYSDDYGTRGTLSLLTDAQSAFSGTIHSIVERSLNFPGIFSRLNNLELRKERSLRVEEFVLPHSADR